MVLFSAPYLHLEYYAAHQVLVSQWYCGCNSQEYREAVEMIMHHVRTMNIPYAISDRRLLPALSPEDLEWSLKVLAEDFIKLPLKRFAIIRSFDEQATKQLYAFLENASFPPTFQVQVFEDLTSAYEWLVSVEA